MTDQRTLIRYLLIASLTLSSLLNAHAFTFTGGPINDSSHNNDTGVSRVTQLKEWIANMRSQIIGSVNGDLFKVGITTPYIGNEQQVMQKFKTQLEKANPCQMIIDKTSNDLCQQENQLRFERIELKPKALKDLQQLQIDTQAVAAQLPSIQTQAQASINGVQAVQSSVDNASGAYSAAAIVGASRTGEGQSKAIELQLKGLYERAKAIHINLKQNTARIDQQIQIVHEIRLEYARAQFVAKEPSTVDKLKSVAAITSTLSKKQNDYKQRADNLRQQNHY